MNYRNKKLLEIVREAPCMMCSMEDGTICAAHSNQLRDGKGTGIKAKDFRIAGLCARCHFMLDNGKELSKEERIALFEEAHRRTIGWLFENGHLIVK